MSGVLEKAESPFTGIEKLFAKLIDETPDERARGCLGVASACELGSEDPDVRRTTALAEERTTALLAETLARAKRRREIKATVDPRAVAQQLHAVFVGLRVMSQGGTDVQTLHGIVATTLGALRRSSS